MSAKRCDRCCRRRGSGGSINSRVTGSVPTKAAERSVANHYLHSWHLCFKLKLCASYLFADCSPPSGEMVTCHYVGKLKASSVALTLVQRRLTSAFQGRKRLRRLPRPQQAPYVPHRHRWAGARRAVRSLPLMSDPGSVIKAWDEGIAQLTLGGM